MNETIEEKEHREKFLKEFYKVGGTIFVKSLKIQLLLEEQIQKNELTHHVEIRFSELLADEEELVFIKKGEKHLYGNM